MPCKDRRAKLNDFLTVHAAAISQGQVVMEFCLCMQTYFFGVNISIRNIVFKKFEAGGFSWFLAFILGTDLAAGHFEVFVRN